MIERELAMLHLTARLARAQTTGHALATERASLVDDLEQARNHAGDANLHLSNDLRAKEATIARLEADVARLDESVSAVLARGDERLATLSADAIARQAELRADIEAREAEIAELDAFERTSQALAEELDGKEALRDAQRRSHLAVLERVARDAEAEREADELEAASQLKRTKAEVRAATDASLAVLAERYPSVRVVHAGENAGPARARNLGMRAARNRWVLAVDNDAIVTEGLLDALCGAAEAWPFPTSGGVRGQPVAAVTDAEGRFFLRHAQPWTRLGVAADGFVSVRALSFRAIFWKLSALVSAHFLVQDGVCTLFLSHFLEA